jgi:hypothetical protein
MIRKKKISALMGAKFEGPLDRIGNVSNCVLGISPYKRLTKNYDDYLVLVVRVDDLEEKYFYADSNGNINDVALDNWLGSSSGAVKKVANQVKTDNEAYQNTLANSPLISSSGTFESNGLLFDGTNDVLAIDDYSELEITTPIISIFVNVTNAGSKNYYYVSRNLDDYTNIQYALKYYSTYSEIMLQGVTRSNLTDANNSQKIIVTWAGTGSNELKMKTETNSSTGTYAGSLTNRTNTQIGARKNSSAYSGFFQGNIKNVLIFNTDEYDNYSNLVNQGL